MKTVGKFLGLGALTTIIDYLLFSALMWAGVDYVVAITAGYGTGLWVNFVIGRRYVFVRGSKVARMHHELLAVSLIALGGLLLNIAVVKLLSYSLLALDPMLSRVIAIGIAFFWNYFARKQFVYH